MAATERPPLRGAVGRHARARGRRTAWGGSGSDRLAGEEPLEIRAAGPRQEAVRVAVTMRTPGNDFELAAGFLHSEGLLRSPLELPEIKYCTDVELGEQAYNVVTVHLRRPFEAELVQRNFGVTSACGVCGKASIDSIEVASEPLPEGPLVAAARDRAACPSGCAPRSARSSAPAARTRPGCSRPTASSQLRARGRRPPQRARQGHRQPPAGRRHAARRRRRARLGPRVVRARAEGRGGRHPGALRRGRAVEPRGGRRAPPRADARRASCATIASTSTPGPRGSLSQAA